MLSTFSFRGRKGYVHLLPYSHQFMVVLFRSLYDQGKLFKS
jgi:hypothetical protein